MSREVIYIPDTDCDICGARGAFDFMGDFFCLKCAAARMEDANADAEALSPSVLLTNAELYALGSQTATPPTLAELDPLGLRLDCRGEIKKK